MTKLTQIFEMAFFKMDKNSAFGYQKLVMNDFSMVHERFLFICT